MSRHFNTALKGNISSLASLLVGTFVLSLQLAILALVVSDNNTLKWNETLLLALVQVPLMPFVAFLGFKAFRSRLAATAFSTTSASIAAACVACFFTL